MDWNHDFAKRVFPEHCDDPCAPLHHLKKEVDEIIEELTDPLPHKESILEEYADGLILLAGSAKRAGISSSEWLIAAFAKMKINESRDWGKPDENGVYQHVASKSAISDHWCKVFEIKGHQVLLTKEFDEETELVGISTTLSVKGAQASRKIMGFKSEESRDIYFNEYRMELAEQFFNELFPLLSDNEGGDQC